MSPHSDPHSFFIYWTYLHTSRAYRVTCSCHMTKTRFLRDHFESYLTICECELYTKSCLPIICQRGGFFPDQICGQCSIRTKYAKIRLQRKRFLNDILLYTYFFTALLSSSFPFLPFDLNFYNILRAVLARIYKVPARTRNECGLFSDC